MFSTSVLAVLLCALLQPSRARYMSLSVNMSVALGEAQRPALSAAVLRSCMKETELSMLELKRFRLSLLSSDPQLLVSLNSDENSNNGRIHDDGDGNGNLDTDADADADANDNANADAIEDDEDVAGSDGTVDDNEDQADANINQYNIVEYADRPPLLLNDQHDESLQCFAHCLYEQLGLISDGVFMAEDLFARLYAVAGRERHLVKECMNLNTNNKCESSYKMHLCYAKLKSLESERRIRKILEYGASVDKATGANKADGEIDAGNYDKSTTEGDPKRNEI